MENIKCEPLPVAEIPEIKLPPARYIDWQLITVKRIDFSTGPARGCIPVLTLPKSLIGKKVKVTIEEI